MVESYHLSHLSFESFQPREALESRCRSNFLGVGGFRKSSLKLVRGD